MIIQTRFATAMSMPIMAVTGASCGTKSVEGTYNVTNAPVPGSSPHYVKAASRSRQARREIMRSAVTRLFSPDLPLPVPTRSRAIPSSAISLRSYRVIRTTNHP